MKNTVLLVAADWAAWDVFGVNWLAHVQRAGISNYVVAALDQVRRKAAAAQQLSVGLRMLLPAPSHS